STDASSHPHSGDLALVVIKGDQMMALVHELYRRAADEA
ncbi:MAG: virulence associated protein, partial [Spirochaetia bacterium]|nr:virulence associated protein [Spirochaetia bacterium]